MTRDDGGPAFPFLVSSEKQSSEVTTFDSHEGISLRDLFAVLVMAGRAVNDAGTADGDAEYAYRAADALLEARKK